MTYVDTSVLVAYYCPEAISPKAEKVITKSESPTISSLTEVEFASAIAKKFRERQISKESVRKIFYEFNSHLSKSFYKRIPLGLNQFSLAFQWLTHLEVPLSTLDALHLAVASTNDLQIITADKQLSRAARKLHIQYILLQ